MKILGIDQSFTSTGFVVVDDEEDILEVGTIKTNEEMGDVHDRVAVVVKELKLVALRHNVDKIALEGLAFNMIGNATRNLAGLQFVIVNNFRANPKYEDHVTIIAPNQIKKFAIKGDATKQEMVDALPKDVLELILNKGYKKTTGLYDITDAYFIAMYTLEEYKKELRRLAPKSA